jgi:NinB protein.
MTQNLLPDGIKLTRLNFQAVGERIGEALSSGNEYRLILKPWSEKRSLSQNATFHMWCGELSDYLTKRGRTQATPEFCKDLLKYTFLGFETKTFTDAITGEQQDVQQLRHTRDLKSADMFDFMTRVQAWAIDIGCFLTVPENCEFERNHHKQLQ